jgi:translation elongation factor EF-Tu-like GTPase
MGLFSRDKGSDEKPEAAPAPSWAAAGQGGAVVVSATDGPMPITREQLQAVSRGGATSVDIALVNTGLVDDEELLELVELEVRELAQQCGLTVNQIVRS